MKKLCLLLALIMTLMSVVTVGVAEDKEVGHIDVLRVGIANMPNTLDPGVQIGNNVLTIFFNVFDTVMFTDVYNDGDVTSYICDSFNVVDDYTTEFRLKEGITFHNGEALTAEDIKYTIDRVVFGDRSYVNANIYTLFMNVKETVVVDEYTVRVITKDPDPVMAERLSSALGLFVVPKDYLEEVGREAFGQAPMGTGPYKVVSYTPDKLVLEYYEGYYGKRPAADRIEYILYPETSTRLTALLNNEIDMCFNLTPDNIAQVENAGLKMDIANVSSFHMLCFNSAVEPTDDVNLRKALNYAIDRELLAETLWGGYAKVRNSYNFPEYGKYYVEDFPAYTYDLEKAKEYLAASDYNGEPIHYELVSNYYALSNEVAEAIVAMWNAIGINASVQYNTKWDFATPHVHNWSNGPRFYDPVAGLYLLWGPETNPAKYNWKPDSEEWKEFCELGKTLATSSDFQTRYDANVRMMELFEDQAVGTVLFQISEFCGMKPNIEWTRCPDYSVSFRAEHLSVK